MDLLITLAIAAGCLTVGVVHWRLARLAPRWPGAVVPALWVGTAVVLVARGTIDSLVDVGGLLLVTVVLARIWHEGRQKRAAKPVPSTAGV